MFSKAAEFESQNFQRARTYLGDRVRGKASLSEHTLDIITHHFTKPLILIAGRHIFLRSADIIDKSGNIKRDSELFGYVPFAILFSSANFEQDSEVGEILRRTSYSSDIKTVFRQAKRVTRFDEATILVGCVFTKDDVIPLGREIEVVKEEGQAKEELPEPPSENSALVPTNNQDLTTEPQKVEYVKLIRKSPLEFYGYASLVREAAVGSRYQLILHSISDSSHYFLPDVGQVSTLDSYNLNKYLLRKLDNVVFYRVRAHPWVKDMYEKYPESDPQQLTGGVLYKNQLVYVANVGDLDYQSLSVVISAAVS